MGVIIMKRLVILGFTLLLILLSGAVVQARILIPLADLEITDYNEEVGLIWNGSQEIVIQKTIIATNLPGLILDLMPLPAEPDFNDNDYGDIFVVSRDNFINNQRGFQHPDYFFETPQNYQKLELVAHKLLHCLGPNNLLEAINDFLAESSQNSIEIADDQLEIIGHYLDEGIEYFQLRLIDAPQAIASRTDSWQFESEILYYPLETDLVNNLRFTLIQSSPYLSFYEHQSVDFNHYIPARMTRPDILSKIAPELPAFFDTILIYSFFWELNL